MNDKKYRIDFVNILGWRQQLFSDDLEWCKKRAKSEIESHAKYLVIEKRERGYDNWSPMWSSFYDVSTMGGETYLINKIVSEIAERNHCIECLDRHSKTQYHELIEEMLVYYQVQGTKDLTELQIMKYAREKLHCKDCKYANR